MKRLALSLIAALAVAGTAYAGQPVVLKAETVATGKITLGDLFEDAGKAAGVVIAAAPPEGGSMVLDAALVQRAAMNNGLTWSNALGVRRVIVRAGTAAEPAAATATSAKPIKGVEVLTWTRNLDAGDLIAAEDLTWATVAVQPPGSPRDPDALIGKVVKKPVRSGAAAVTRDVAAQQVIKKDDMVTVAYETDGIRLSLQAKAMGGASVGETLTLTNPQSKKTFQAVASGPGQALVGPEAQALKAQALSNPAQFAVR